MAHALRPIGAIVSAMHYMRFAVSRPRKYGVPIICVGNLVLGGTGKTPTAIAIGRYFNRKGIAVHFLSRGYKRKRKDPILVDRETHKPSDVGDEPLLLAEIGPTWVYSDRRLTAKLAIETGAQVLIMDDGYQNHAIGKDISIIVVDGEVGFGNQKVFPAGPLRENIKLGLKRADAILILGDDKLGLYANLRKLLKPKTIILQALLKPDKSADKLAGERVFAFSGIGRPQKFFDTLTEIGCSIVGTAEFGDHHIYNIKQIDRLIKEARKSNARLVTTTKDLVKLTFVDAKIIEAVPVSVLFKNYNQLDSLFEPLLRDNH